MVITELCNLAGNNVLMSVEEQSTPKRVVFSRNKAEITKESTSFVGLYIRASLEDVKDRVKKLKSMSVQQIGQYKKAVGQ